MNYKHIHSWKVDKARAIQIQQNLAEQIDLNDEPDIIKTVAGCDVAYSESFNRAFAAICLFSYPEIKKIDEVKTVSDIKFPYLRGLLTFREGPALLRSFKSLNSKPDVIIFNGQGIAHPLKLGLATHLGILLDTPSIGCAQRAMIGYYDLPENTRKACTKIINRDREVIGICLRTRKGIKPVFVSQGYKIGLKTAMEIILNCTIKYKMPEPLRTAHISANITKNLYLKLNNGKA